MASVLYFDFAGMHAASVVSEHRSERDRAQHTVATPTGYARAMRDARKTKGLGREA